LFSKLRSHELSLKGGPNHDASFTSKALINSARVSGHDANPTNTISPSLEFALFSLHAAFDKQYESIPDDKIALIARKFQALHMFQRRGEETPETPGAASSAATPRTSSLTAPRGRSMTTITRTTTPTRTTTATRTTTTRTTTPTRTTTATRMIMRRKIALKIKRRTSRRSCPEHV
jgi:hypothetical protein